MEYFLIFIVALIVLIVLAGSIFASLPSEISGKVLARIFKQKP